ncbi:MAG: holo-ACP synthase [Oscillospiraceae bacterium]
MIFGIGIDSAEIARLAKSAQRENFINRCFGASEILLYEKRGKRAETLAAAFAAKEALAKALGVGLFAYDMRSIELLRHDSGRPYFVLHTEILQFIEENNLRIQVSVTHEAGIATAIVVVENI